MVAAAWEWIGIHETEDREPRWEASKRLEPRQRDGDDG